MCHESIQPSNESMYTMLISLGKGSCTSRLVTSTKWLPLSYGKSGGLKGDFICTKKNNTWVYAFFFKNFITIYCFKSGGQEVYVCHESIQLSNESMYTMLISLEKGSCTSRLITSTKWLPHLYWKKLGPRGRLYMHKGKVIRTTKTQEIFWI